MPLRRGQISLNYQLRIWRCDWDEERIQVFVTIDDRLGWGGHPSIMVERDVNELAVVGAEEWVKEGF